MAGKKKTDSQRAEEYIRGFAEQMRRSNEARDAMYRRAGGTKKELQGKRVQLIRQRDYLLQEIPKLRDGGKLKEARAGLKELEQVVKQLDALAKP